jgi:hypothetical protein
MFWLKQLPLPLYEAKAFYSVYIYKESSELAVVTDKIKMDGHNKWQQKILWHDT